MSNILDGLLQYSHAGHHPKQTTLVNTKELLTHLIERLNPASGFSIKLPDNLPIFETRVMPLEKVFLLLLDNAIRHHHEDVGAIEIAVSVKELFYEFSVKDDGPGIEPAFQQKIFELFQTLQPRDVLETSGVGLSIAIKIVESEGGTIWLVSEKNKGTTFYFTWPKA